MKFDVGTPPTIVVHDLPRSHPWRLDAGREALRAARMATERALDRPIREGVVRLTCNLTS